MPPLSLSAVSEPPRAEPPSAGAASVERYPASRRAPPRPLALPWPLRPVSSASSGTTVEPGGAVRYWIQHDVLAGVTPRMLVWWFSHLEGDVEVGGVRHDRYRVWHPRDHVHVSYARRLPDGSVGPGAAIRIVELLGGDPRHRVDVTSEIERLDEGGFVHNPAVHVLGGRVRVGGLARMEYTFTPVAGGTLYENCLVLGRDAWWSPLAMRALVPSGHGEHWIRHNVEEVGQFEHFLPALYHRETNRRS